MIYVTDKALIHLEGRVDIFDITYQAHTSIDLPLYVFDEEEKRIRLPFKEVEDKDFTEEMIKGKELYRYQKGNFEEVTSSYFNTRKEVAISVEKEEEAREKRYQEEAKLKRKMRILEKPTDSFIEYIINNVIGGSNAKE